MMMLLFLRRCRSLYHRRFSPLVVGLVSLLSILIALGPAIPVGVTAAPPMAMLQIEGTTQIDPGGQIDLKLSIRNGNDVAGFESSVLFDPSAAEFAGLQVADNSVHSLGRDVGQLAAVETSYGASIGFYSCPGSNCLDNKSPRKFHGAGGTVALGTLSLIGDAEGKLAITFDAVKAVDASGNTIPLANPSPTFFVQVGSGGATSQSAPAATSSGPVHTSPPGRWKLPGVGVGRPGPFSTTGTGTVTNADVMEVAMAWENLRARSNPCGADVDPRLDVNHDGCIDVADVQAVAANYSPTNTSRTESPASGVSPSVSAQATSTTFVVNSTGDQDDVNKGDGICQTSAGTCTLRAAVAEANNDSGPNTINFNIPGTGVQTIHLNSPMHTIFDTTGGTTIDGYTQPGSSPNTDPMADNAKIMIQIQGGGYTQYDAMAISSAGNVIRGLAFFNFHRTLWFYGKGATDNVVVGDFVGTNAAGTAHATAIGDAEAHGIKIEQGAARTTVGRPNLADRNVISGNARSGVGIWHGGSNDEVVQNNIIGLSPSGTARLSNYLHGVDMNYGTKGDIIGGTGQYEHNVMSGNNYNGIDVSHTAGTSFNHVVGNFVGTNLAGTASPGFTYNLRYGIRVKDGVANNTITDNVVGGMSGHVTDGNGDIGIIVLDSTTNTNTFQRNRVGISLNGTAMPNGTGMVVYGHDNVIGPDNVIADNAGAGIEIQSGAVRNTITKNSIFGNGGLGIKLDSGGNNGIGAPVITTVTTSQVSGTACASCTVEAFIADGGAGAPGEGKTFVGSGTAGSNGSFTVNVTGVSSGNEITATATDGSGNTSPFAANVQVGGGSQAINLPGHFESEDYNPGGEGTGYHDTTAGNTGGAYRQDDVDIQATQDSSGTYNVGWIAAGEWLAYTVNVNSAGSYTFALRVASPNNGTSLHIELDGSNISGSIAVPNTGGWQTWQTVTTSAINLPAGTHVLLIVANTSGFNLNYVDVAAATQSASINLPGHFEVEDYNPGGEGTGYHDTTSGNTGGAYRQDDVDIQTTQDSSGTFNVGWIAAGEWLAYSVDVGNAGNYTFAIRVASPNSGSRLHLEIDGTNVSGAIAVPNTGGWQTWQTVTTSAISLTAGAHTLRIVAETNGFNLNFVDVAAA
jgi:CSLREA domain-containing protein